jgi:hypothetical protein
MTVLPKKHYLWSFERDSALKIGFKVKDKAPSGVELPR